ncbi:MAG: hypothetical protein LKF87_12335 [Clostridium tyrobutyricum]|uniref:hypothetical protein n=1 Tax=Clostridium tyrobutyricum TaxID=1519 RepID=UPI00242B1F7E|nr:hypothetical protein [Clostridium tyrobutyricum]MCH4200146.1 hypothetical protein [Clostridium tyrobutyricum]MCH4259714.1 hypothetical protein [Clostridium tyrobutyricum]
MKKIYYPPDDIKGIASIYESEICQNRIYLYRRVPEEEIEKYYKKTEVYKQRRLLLLTIDVNKQVNIDKIINRYWDVIRTFK